MGKSGSLLFASLIAITRIHGAPVTCTNGVLDKHAPMRVYAIYANGCTTSDQLFFALSGESAANANAAFGLPGQTYPIALLNRLSGGSSPAFIAFSRGLDNSVGATGPAEVSALNDAAMDVIGAGEEKAAASSEAVEKTSGVPDFEVAAAQAAPSQVPEPIALSLTGSGLIALGLWRKKIRS